MRCKYLIAVLEPRPEFHDDERLEVVDGHHYWPIGTVEDHPKAYRLVRMGIAEPDDDECRLVAAVSTQDMKAAGKQYEMVSKGIEPDDYQRYLDGEILGYDTAGNDLPGPNWKRKEDEDDEE